ncbi:efflux RND transporter permease subunit [Sinorhizobium meliloti]|jgi:hydrophobe/amphiphile efflux-1 (HAE1) family protein|uniref:efflux RND transporter permease subunit n=1 Tax=Rhizobium meliloti TaxID=382 RepID=UPI000FD8AE70|nr:efflux RND transporter permease subunit [Sinorhizobium meliloti]MDX0136261.1 MMPL family transporter [Sinorhizobium meliloti]MDX0379578.1 MMPL family transporter [Sinorhizobium meliloti]RVG59494.1 efflux RND transporter permease subunit [Sinorhizobium meliloti]RVH47912.1 efflux RND transporter permease subunit [Sinorhizobium meliloti]RVO70100.1 efflux RND transporter permease subunit [Sinorhizobium meliloti]
MNFSAWSIRNPVAPILAFFVLVVLGWQSFNSLPITRFPNIDVPIVSIAVTQSGAAPAELETQVTKEIEDAVAGVSGVDHIESTITDGISTTAVIFRMEVPTTQAVQDVKDAIDRIRSDLPTSIEEPIVSKVDVEGQAIQTFSVSSPGMTLEELSWFVDDTIKRAIQGQTGIGRVDRYGGSDREVRVELDEDRLNSFGISAADVNAQLRRMNMDLGSGRGQVGGSEQAIRTLGDTRDVTALAGTMISLPNGRFVRLSELGKVIDTYEEPKSFSRFNGQPGVTFAVFRAKGASEVSVAETVGKTLDEIRAKHPDVSIEMVDDSVYFTYGNYEAAIHTLIEGAVLAVIVVMLFLRNWRATLISAVALPLSAIPTFWVMELLGFSLNLVSFLAMTLATGILVDDAIVEIENIERHIRMGKSPYRAAIEAADEIGLAVIATTFTIIAVFVPVSFMPGIPGQYFIQFGLTVAVSVFFSLLVARLITPVMAAYLMKPSDVSGHHDDEGFMMRQYTRLVRFTTKRWYTRYSTLLAAILVSVGSVVALLVFVPGSFLPPEDSSRVSLSIELPPDAMLADTDRTTTEIYNRVKDIDGVENVFVLGGASPKGDLELRRAAVTVLLEKLDHSLINKVVNDVIGRTPLIGQYLPKLPPAGRIKPQSEIEKEIFARLRSIPDVRVTKLNDRGERDLSFNLLSSNEADLDKAVATLEADLRRDPLLANVSPEGALPRPELQIRPRDEQMSRLGITTAQISEVIRIATIGDIDAQLTKIALDGRLIPIRVQLDRDFRTDLAAIRNLKVQTASGATVPLSSVADINYAEGPSSIKRYDRYRVVKLGADLPAGVALDTASARFREIAADADLPETVQFLESGDAEVQAEMQESFGNAMLLGLMMVLVVLILLFKDVIQPFTILFSLPLAIGGVAAALILTQNALSMPVLIGILMLMGIVTKNAILLVDFGIEMMHHGMDRTLAMIEAGRKRARPIVMTSIAMSAGMLPSALGVGEGGSFRAPMAIAVIGGIIVSTVLSLVVVPSFFLIMDDLSRLLAWAFGRFIGKKDEEELPLDQEALSKLAAEQGSTIESLEERIKALEDEKRRKSDGKVISHPALAAE